jgi:hypothetical protein
MRLRLILAAFGAALLVGLGLALGDEEIRDTVWLHLSPASFRDAQLQCFAGPSGQHLYLMGTIHGAHLTTPAYPLTQVRAVIVHLRPDLVLVEARPEEVARGNLGDGPIEALYAELAARQAGLASSGIDWWTMGADHQVNPPGRDDRMVANLLQAADGRPVSLALVGYSHAGPFRDRLVARGWRPVPVPAAEKARLFDASGLSADFPVGMSAFVRRRIAADQATLATTSDRFWRQRLQDAIVARQSLLKTIAVAGEG